MKSISASAAFRDAVRYISKPGKWRQDGHYGLRNHPDVQNRPCCLIGALLPTNYSHSELYLFRSIHDALRDIGIHVDSVTQFNDNNTLEEVVTLGLLIAEALDK